MPFAKRPPFSWRLRTRTLELGPKTLIMGILNVTPDSFSDGGHYLGPNDAIDHGLKLIDQGAHVLDLGGESTRPDATPVGTEEEQSRVLPILTAILRAHPGAVISIDTYHAETARVCVEAGAEIVNDVSGGLWDADMLSVMAATACGAILMHTRGRPTEWATLPPLDPDDVIHGVRNHLAERAQAAQAAGISSSSILLDPGFGFGKSGPQNYPLLAHLDSLASLGFPILAGISRKGFLAKSAQSVHKGTLVPAHQRLNLTTAANTAAILAGAYMLRVHDVPEALEAAAIADAFLAATSTPPA